MLAALMVVTFMGVALMVMALVVRIFMVVA